MDVLKKLILSKVPEYDFDRYRFKPGDYVRTVDGARVLVKESALEYVTAYVLKRSLVYRELGEQRVYYKDLPCYNKGEFVNKLPENTRSIKWSKFDFVHLEDGNMYVLLTDEVKHQGFYAFVLSSDMDYYLHTCVYVENPHKDYIPNKVVI